MAAHCDTPAATMADSLDRNLRAASQLLRGVARAGLTVWVFSVAHQEVIGVEHGHHPHRPQALPKPQLQ